MASELVEPLACASARLEDDEEGVVVVAEQWQQLPLELAPGQLARLRENRHGAVVVGEQCVRGSGEGIGAAWESIRRESQRASSKNT